MSINFFFFLILVFPQNQIPSLTDSALQYVDLVVDEMQKHIMALLPSPIANNACVQSAIEDGEKSASQAEHCIGNAVANNMMDYNGASEAVVACEIELSSNIMQGIMEVGSCAFTGGLGSIFGSWQSGLDIGRLASVVLGVLG